MTTKRIYLDVCCLNRPFDNQSIDRVRLEAEAVVLVLKHIEQGHFFWVSSEAVNYEVEQNADAGRKARVGILMKLSGETIEIEEDTLLRASDLELLGFGGFDALHVACAEKAKAEVILTTDDRLVKLGSKFQRRLKTRVLNPLEWIRKEGFL
jgi:predicted nucleic acid-binding protein